MPAAEQAQLHIEPELLKDRLEDFLRRLDRQHLVALGVCIAALASAAAAAVQAITILIVIPGDSCDSLTVTLDIVSCETDVCVAGIGLYETEF